MTSWVVIDSGIFIAIVMNEPLRQQAQQLLAALQTQNTKIAAPYLIQYEFVSVMRKHVNRNSITPQEGVKRRDYLLQRPMHLHHGKSLLKRAYELAEKFNCPTAYDSQYLVVAEHLNCEFWTADERLYNAVHQQLPWVKWISSL